jgi:acetyl-CoA carboxylase carboxyltransferase component
LAVPAPLDASSVLVARRVWQAELSGRRAQAESMVLPASRAQASQVTSLACRARVESTADPDSAVRGLAAASASPFPVVVHQPVVFHPTAAASRSVAFRPEDDTVVSFPAAEVAILSAAGTVVAVAGNKADDTPAEIPDSSRPTSTDSRNTAPPRNKPFRRPSSFASRSSPSRSSSY